MRIAATLTGELFKRGEEWFAVPWINPILDCDQHRSAIRLDLMGDDRCRPMHRRCKVNACPGLELPAPRMHRQTIMIKAPKSLIELRKL